MHKKGTIVDAIKARKIMTKLAGRLGFYMGLISAEYLPVISGDQKTYMNGILAGFLPKDDHNRQIQVILCEVSRVMTGQHNQTSTILRRSITMPP